MTIIKEKCVRKDYNNIIFIVRSDTYSEQLDHINNMASILIRDFPPHESDIRVVKYGGVRYNGTFGVEVTVPMTYAYRNYDEYATVKNVEYTK